jgi:SAM-dependent methyltransferase
VSRARFADVIPPELDAMTPDVPRGMFDEAFRHACERLDRFVGTLTAEVAGSLGIEPGALPGVPELLRRHGWSEYGELAVEWLLETLALFGRAERNDTGWRIGDLSVAVASAALHADAVSVDPAAEPSYRVLELSAAALPAVLAGETRGEEVLFGPATLGLWFDYFSNDNPLYAPTNALTAVALERCLGPGAHILELGGGGGSAAQAAIRRLMAAGKPPARYVFTELQPAFLRRGARAITSLRPPECELQSLRVDINENPAEQGLAERSFDAIFAVNTLHLAHDLPRTLAALAGLLRPGGAIVVGELMRPAPTAAVHLELPFTYFQAYREVRLDHVFRPRPGFLSARGWRHALSAAGLGAASLLPANLERCTALYPGFYCGALTATV